MNILYTTTSTGLAGQRNPHHAPRPINRGVELTSDVADSNHSMILNQVENGVAVRMAVLYLLAGRVQ